VSCSNYFIVTIAFTTSGVNSWHDLGDSSRIS